MITWEFLNYTYSWEAWPSDTQTKPRFCMLRVWLTGIHRFWGSRRRHLKVLGLVHISPARSRVKRRYQCWKLSLEHKVVIPWLTPCVWRAGVIFFILILQSSNKEIRSWSVNQLFFIFTHFLFVKFPALHIRFDFWVWVITLNPV